MMIHLAHLQLELHGLFSMLAIQIHALLEVTFSHWKSLGLETEYENQYFCKEQSIRLNVNHDIHADASYVEATKEQPNKILVDTRERLNFLTEHIPGAKNIPYTMLGSTAVFYASLKR